MGEYRAGVNDLRQTILEELTISRQIVGDGHEVGPRFVIFAPDGPHVVGVQLPDEDDEKERQKRFEVVRLFMIYKAALGFTLATELKDPDAISVIAVTRTEVIGAVQRITRKPLSFSEPHWFDRGEVADEIVSLLPPKVLSVSRDDLVAMRQMFEDGMMPGITWVKE